MAQENVFKPKIGPCTARVAGFLLTSHILLHIFYAPTWGTRSKTGYGRCRKRAGFEPTTFLIMSPRPLRYHWFPLIFCLFEYLSLSPFNREARSDKGLYIPILMLPHWQWVTVLVLNTGLLSFLICGLHYKIYHVVFMPLYRSKEASVESIHRFLLSSIRRRKKRCCKFYNTGHWFKIKPGRRGAA